MVVWGQVSGAVHIRPVRVGMAFKPSMDSLHRAVEQATSAWGGVYYPFLSSEDDKTVHRLANALSVDVIHAVDAEPASERLAELPGYQWQGFPSSGLFGPPGEGISPQLLGPEGLLDDPRNGRLVLPRWDPTDPLSGLYAVWHGHYGNSEYERALAARFAAAAKELPVGATDPQIPDITGQLTPIGLTGVDIEHTGLDSSTGIIALDAQDPVHLIAFWNLRACGAQVFPWPLGHGERLAQAADLWLQHVLDGGEVRRRRSGAGEEREPCVDVWMRQRQQAVPDPLMAVLRERGVAALPWAWEDHWGVLRGWTGSHPLRTDSSRTFSIPVTPNEHTVVLPMPPVGPPAWRRGRRQAGTVAAQVDIFSQSGLGPDWTVIVPNVRDVAALLTNFPTVLEAFHRPTHSGRALGVQADADSVLIDPVRSFSVFERLLDGSGWVCRHTDTGRFASRLVELLGGIGSEAGNQPAVRAVLHEAARTPRGKPIAALIQTASRQQGSWPGPFSSPASQASYPKRVVYDLLARQLLRPLLPIKCPRCATESLMRPEDLAVEVRCEMCSEGFPLGLALGLSGGRVDWLYRLAGNVPVDRLAETLPVMASLTVLSLYRRLSPTTVPHVLGLQLTGPNRSWEADIDITLTVDDGGLPLVVVGEVKSHRDPIDGNDLANLARVQQYLRGKNIECFVLAATLRDRLQPQEHTALRAFCENPPDTVYRRSSSVDPVMPIVLTGRDLSAPQHSDEHPMSWRRPGSEGIFGMVGLATESCRRNLGLAEVGHQPTTNGVSWRPRWT